MSVGIVEIRESNGGMIALHGTVSDVSGQCELLALYSNVNELSFDYKATDWVSVAAKTKYVRSARVIGAHLFHDDMAPVAESEIFVFGSNLKGRHGKGAALTAMKQYGAEYGVGEGFTGRCYALPTRNANQVGEKAEVTTLTLAEVRKHIKVFMDVAESKKDKRFYVSRVGCGHAGFSDEQIAPLFAGAPANCSLPIEWMSFI